MFRCCWQSIDTDEAAGKKVDDKPVNTDELQLAAMAIQKAIAETDPSKGRLERSICWRFRRPYWLKLMLLKVQGS